MKSMHGSAAPYMCGGYESAYFKITASAMDQLCAALSCQMPFGAHSQLTYHLVSLLYA